MSLNISKESKKKRKRNTTDEQYEIYLYEMERDYSFRSGTINPSQELNYVEKKWESLCEKLNAAGSGPELTVEDWKKRFKDWKNATRAKYRKINEDRVQTGGGPQSNIKLTALEDRGLSVWGKVAVEGCALNIEGGLPVQQIAIQNENYEKCIYQVAENVEVEEIYEGHETQSPVIILTEQNDGREIKEKCIEKKNKKKDKRVVLNDIAVNLQKAYEKGVSATENLVTELNNVAKMYERVEERKLQFEIAKYKFENPTFEYEFK